MKISSEVLDKATDAYCQAWCASVEGEKGGYATFDDESDRKHAREGVRAALEDAVGDMVRDAERYRFIASDHSAAWEEELDAAIAAHSGAGEGREGGV